MNPSHPNVTNLVAPNPAQAPQAFLEFLYWAAVRRALPAYTQGDFLPIPPAHGRTLVLGAGKASGAMAHAFDALWPQDAPMSGLVITRYDHTPPRDSSVASRIEVVEAAHPVPDAAGLEATRRMLAMTEGLTDNDLVVCLISGGGSSLLTLPAEGLELADKQRINKELLNSGATISEMNCVRKHLSAIKGGRLAAACASARVVTLLISDVPGDDPSVIASGPTVPDPSTCAEALAVLDRYGIAIPEPVRARLQRGELETPKPGDAVFARNTMQMIATPQQSLEAAAAAARAAGLQAYILSDAMEGESREVGKVHAALALAVAQQGQPFQAFTRPCVILSGGETTVTIRPLAPGAARGQGGRAGEFCMGLAAGLQGHPGVFALAADSDGIDGTQDNAGARVLPDTLARAAALGYKLPDFLDRNDACGFFGPLGDLVVTGPTFTNVNDFRAVLIL